MHTEGLLNGTDHSEQELLIKIPHILKVKRTYKTDDR